MRYSKRLPVDADGFPWVRVEKGSLCWPWIGALTDKGYGHYSRGKKDYPAHRASWEEAHGAIPKGMFVLHHCDNPPCVKTEPDERYPQGHLYLGTQAENMRDAAIRGRAPTKLTARDVVAIRGYVSQGWPKNVVALMFGVTPPLVGYIARRRIWKHLP